MMKFQRWMLRKIASRTVIQGDHKIQIEEYYSILVDAARKEFTEDNKPTLDGFLEECHKKSLRRV